MFNIIERTKDVLEEVSPQLQGDILEDGIIMSGGGSLLKGLPEKISKELSIPVRLSDFPVAGVARGAGFALDKPDSDSIRFYKKAYIHD